MAFEFTSRDYADYILRAYDRIHENGDYITQLDSATGDGDHWHNIDTGFAKLKELAEELAAISLADQFKKIGMTMMSVIGGSSGVLYGSAYIAAAKTLDGVEAMGAEELCNVLVAMSDAIMHRGQAKPGDKTMLDSLYPAVECLQECIASRTDEKTMLNRVKKAAIEGAQSTADMEAVRGRAVYQANKGKGHLDPGAVTMSYQLEVLMDSILAKL